ncbi:hypothetical protein N8077_01520 [Myxococcota bacterium]|nr:hypothetical protein [Myxococcota bacterium]
MNGDHHVVPESNADLIIGTTYAGRTPDIGDEPISTLLPCGNMGGFRARGSIENKQVDLVALVTTFADPEWHDDFDKGSGRFTYFGDNKKPGRDLHDTSRKGNELLRWIFSAVHVQDHQRHLVPPFFVFAKRGENRAATFLGIAAPGARHCSESDDLVASWTTRGNDRFQNYRAVFTVLDIPIVSRSWITELEQGVRNGPNAPTPWTHWLETGAYRSSDQT